MKRARPKMGLLLVLGMLTALLPIGALTPAAAVPVDIAYDLVGTTSLNLTSHTNAFDDAWGSGDGFEKYQLGVDTDIPFAVVDESAVGFPGDNQGVIPESNTEQFFGICDTENSLNTGAVSATWVFDVSGYENLSLSIDMGAMGDFEATGTNDVFSWEYSIDGGASSTAFSSTVDESLSQDYTMADGATYTLNDPMLVGSTVLTNDLATFVAPLSGSGEELVLTLTAQSDGGSEGMAFQNIIISGEAAPTSTPELVINEILQNPAAVGDDSGEWLELFNPTSSDIDIDGWTLSDNDIDSHDIDNGSPLIVPAGGYLVLGNNTDSATNGGAPVAYSYGTNWFLSNSADEVVLTDDLGAEVDRVEYDGGTAWPDPTGASMALNDPSNDNADGANWCEATTAFGDGDLGTPGAANDCPPAPSANVFISELHYDNAGADAGEFVEVAGDAGADLTDWSVELYNGYNGESYATLSLTGTIDDENGSLGAVSVAYAGIQNGAPDGVALVDPGGAVVEFLSYEGSFAATNGPASGMTSIDIGVSESSSTAAGESLQLVDGAWIGPVAESPGLLNTAPPITPTAIYTVQGSGLASPFDGQIVVVEGVVTSDQQDGELNGFFMQDVAGDGDPATSDGIYVFEGGNSVAVNVGDVVRVQGTVDEFFDMTEITDVSSVEVVGTAPVVATPVALPWMSLDQPEQYEGMYVTVPQTLYISEYFNFDRFGEIVLTTDRALQPTAIYNPGSPEATALAEANQLARITLDDNRTSQNPDPAIHPNGLEFTLDNTFRGGDMVANVTGVMNYSFGLYRIQPTQGADYTRANPRPEAHDEVGGTLEVASFNVLNYFTTLDDSGSICGPDGDLGCRGADNAEEFDRQRTKIIAAISEINADVVGLMEIENNTNAIVDLVAGLNDLMGAGTYAYVDTGVIGTDAIKVAFIYKPATVSLNGAYSILDSTVDPTFNDDKNRPALAQTFTQLANSESVTVVVNHLKSKGSSCDDVGDPDLGDGAGNCNLTRTAAAVALANWLADDTNGFDDDVLIIGDLNSYDKEDPIDALLAAGYSDLIFDFLGEDAYSYVFSGQWGYLDYALANSALQSAVTGTTVWHINADEADLIDYDTTFKQDAQDALYEPNAYRASDHDPVIVGLQLDRTAPDVTAEFDKVWAGISTGYFVVDFACSDAGDPNPDCVGDINGIEVEDGQRVVLIKAHWGTPWHRRVGSVLFIKDTSFTLTVTGTDQYGNTATATAEPAFRVWRGWRAR